MPTVRRASVHFFCADTCKASDRKKKYRPGTEVSLIADGTDVTLRFENSPFVSGHKIIRISAGTFKKEIIGTTPDTFTYALSCNNCLGQNDDADFIVEL
jgi:hypothetical protein